MSAEEITREQAETEAAREAAIVQEILDWKDLEDADSEEAGWAILPRSWDHTDPHTGSFYEFDDDDLGWIGD